MLAASMGWLMFEPFLIEAAGLDEESPDELAGAFNALLKRLTQSVLLLESDRGEDNEQTSAEAGNGFAVQ
jgi:hypothetical protein